jgi:adenylate cyclase
MSSAPGRNYIAQDVFRTSVAWTLGANLVGLVVVGIYTNVVSPFPSSSTTSDVAFWVVIAPLFVAAAVVVGFLWVRRAFEPTHRFLREGRPPTADERRRTLGLPLLVTKLVLGAWIVAALLTLLPFGVAPNAFGRVSQAVIAIVLGGVTTALLTFLLLERCFRPLYSVVLAADAPSPTARLGIGPRLLATWALGSGVPLLVLLFAPIGSALSRDELQSLNWYLGAVGLAAGAVLIFVAGRSVADPIQGLRVALRTVQDGRLEVVAVEDCGEVGLLQAGFNRMVVGLQERQRLQDLFGRHVGTEVARDALERQIELGGREQDVSVLFVDLIGSTALTQRLEPKQVVAVLNDFFAAVVSATHAEGGWVNKFEGDAALCVFGAPSEFVDHAARALRTARTLRAAIDGLARAHPGLDAGIGVSSGTVIAGNVGALDRYEYTVIGDPVNEAARLTEIAKERRERVVASASAIGAAPDERRRWKQAELILLRGRSQPTQTFTPRAVTA